MSGEEGINRPEIDHQSGEQEPTTPPADGQTQYHIDTLSGDAVAVGQGAQAIVYKGWTAEQVSGFIADLKRADQPRVWDGRIPYLGLKSFQEVDAQFFFGRETLIEELLQRVQEANFIVISGPSGSGKSSVARAGLLHALRAGRIEHSDHWLLATMSPKGEPLEQLAQAAERLARTPGSGNFLREQGGQNPLALYEQVETLLGDDERQRCLLLVDQFEEVFTQTKDPAGQTTFINLLTQGVQAEKSRLIVVLAMRSDFVSHCAKFPELRALMSRQFQLVGALEPRDLAQAITLPALEVGAEIDPELVSTIINDMKGEPGALPLMSFALRDLFIAEKTRPGEPMDLTLAEYLQRGGIESALERHANRVFAGFSAEQQELAGSIFSRLIEVGQGRVDTRRTATFAELVPAGAGRNLVAATVARLAEEDVRLVTTGGIENSNAIVDSIETAITVTLAHEKLIDAWPWLRQLVDDNRELIALQNQINRDAHAWAEQEDIGYLYRGGRLLQVEEVWEQLQPGLDALSQQFIQASLDQRKTEINEAEARRQKELAQQQELAEAQRKRAEEAEIAAAGMRRRRNIALGFAAGSLILAVLSFFLFQLSNQNAANAATQATAAAYNLATATLAQGQAADNAATAVANAAIADANAATAEAAGAAAIAAQATSDAESLQRATAQRQAEDAAAEAEEQARITQSQALAVAADAVSDNNPVLAIQLALEAESAAETGLAFASANRTIPAVARVQNTFTHDESVSGATWNGDESRILSWAGGTVQVWDVQTGIVLLIFQNGEVFDLDSSILGATWNADESRILTWSRDGTAQIWDGRNGNALFNLSHNDVVIGATWNADESRILSWGWDGTAQVWDGQTGSALLTLPHNGSVWGAAWNADESRILTWSYGGTAQVWDGQTGNTILTLIHDTEALVPSVRGASWNGDESRILTWSNDGTAQVWNAQNGNTLLTLPHDLPVSGATWNADESRILTWSEDGTAKVWDGQTGNALLTLVHSDVVGGATWNADESRILTWSPSGIVQVWDSNNGTPKLNFTHGEIYAAFLNGATWNADESRILTWSNDGTAKVWDGQTGNGLLTFTHDTEALSSSVIGAAWSADESRILTWSNDGTARIWDGQIETPLPTLRHQGLVWGATWNDDESHILTWATDGAKVWDGQSENPLLTYARGSYSGAVWNADGSRILTWRYNGTAEVWDSQSETLLLTLPHDNVTQNSLVSGSGATWNGDESRILTWSRDGTARVWDGQSEIPLLTLTHDSEANNLGVLGATWNTDESRILTWSEDNTARVWDGQTGTALLTLTHDSDVFGAAWNGDESRILSWSADSTAKIWDGQTGNAIFTLVHDHPVRGATWNADESRILTWNAWNDDGTAMVWDGQTGNVLLTLQHNGLVTGATWNGDESRILTWDAGETAKVWDGQTGSTLLALPHDGEVLGATWNRDDSRILTWSEDGTARVWDGETGRELAILEGDGTPVTSAQWNAAESLLMITTEGGNAGGKVFRYLMNPEQLVEAGCARLQFNIPLAAWQRYMGGVPYRCTCSDLPAHPTVLAAENFPLAEDAMCAETE